MCLWNTLVPTLRDLKRLQSCHWTSFAHFHTIGLWNWLFKRFSSGLSIKYINFIIIYNYHIKYIYNYKIIYFARLKEIYIVKFMPILKNIEGKTSFIGLCILLHSWRMFLLCFDLGKIPLFWQDWNSNMQHHELQEVQHCWSNLWVSVFVMYWKFDLWSSNKIVHF